MDNVPNYTSDCKQKIRFFLIIFNRLQVSGWKLIKKISNLKDQGFSTGQIMDSIREEAQPSVTSESQLTRCIASIKGKEKPESGDLEIENPGVEILGQFDPNKYQKEIEELKEKKNSKDKEKIFDPIAKEILGKEGFEKIENVNKQPGEKFQKENGTLSSPPFDYKANKNGQKYFLEMKGSLKNFNSPGETQKRRLLDLRNYKKGTHFALLQIKLAEGIYRIRIDGALDRLLKGRQIPLDKVKEWIVTEMKATTD
jgi:hypothetical protein